MKSHIEPIQELILKRQCFNNKAVSFIAKKEWTIMASRTERQILFFELTIKASSRRKEFKAYDGLTPPSARELFRAIELTHRKQKFIIPIAHGSKSVYFQDMKVSNEKAIFLVNLSDRDAADPIFSDPEIDSHRVARRKGNEGVEGSAHIVINLDPVRTDTYAVVIESTAGLSSTRLSQFLGLYVRKAKKEFPSEFVANDPSGEIDKNGEFKKIPIMVRLDLIGQPSEQLIRDINEGTLTGLEVITVHPASSKWDEHGYVVEKSHTATLDIAGVKSSRGKNWAILGEVFKSATKRDMDQIRVRFKSNTGVNRSVMIDPATGRTLLDDAYIKKEILGGFKRQLESAYDKIHPELTERMFKHIE